MHQISAPIEELTVPKSAIIKWLDNSTRVIKSLLDAEKADETAPVTPIRMQLNKKNQDQMRRELFCNPAHENLGSDCKMASYGDFMHIAFQLLPITEIILQSDFVADSCQRL